MTAPREGTSGVFPSSDELAYHKLFRDRVVHEDTLIYHRISWLLATQTILFVLWAAVLRDPSAIKNVSLSAITIGIGLFGMLSCFVSFLGVWAALSEIKHLLQCYEKHHPKPHSKLPPIVGNPDNHLVGKVPPYLLIFACFSGWVLILVFFR